MKKASNLSISYLSLTSSIAKLLTCAFTLSISSCTSMQPADPPVNEPPPQRTIQEQYGIEQVPPPAPTFECPDGPQKQSCQTLATLYSKNQQTWQLSYGSTWMKDPNICKWEGVDCDSNGNIIGLNLPSKGITVLPNGAFANFPDLKELNLKENQISAVPKDAFLGTTSLEKLDLSVNRLVEVPGEALSVLTMLQELTLEHNQIASIAPGGFANLTSLRLLNLENNQLTEVPTAAILGLAKLKECNLKKNQITIVRAKAFFGLALLENIYLSENPISQVEVDAFLEVPNLDTLNLVDISTLSMLPDGLFRKNRKFRRLNLSYSNNVQLSPVLCQQLKQVDIDPDKLCRTRP